MTQSLADDETDLHGVPCVLMRGGTSRGPYFRESDLPTDVAARDRVLLAAMGSPHPLQIDGIGGGNSLTSKVAIVGAPSIPESDVDYLFAQVSVDRALVDTSPNCGNMLSGVGPFAIEAGMVAAQDGETSVRIYNRNTGSLITARIQTPGGRVRYSGTAAIDGVPGTAAPIALDFSNAAGGKTGALFPTGNRQDEIDGIPVTLIDYAMPMMLIEARHFGISGHETASELDANAGLLERMEKMRREAGRRMGLGDVSDMVIPKVGLLSEPAGRGHLASRYFVPLSCHRAHAATGALCVGVAASLPGTVAVNVAKPSPDGRIAIEHPSGIIDVTVTLRGEEVVSAGLIRTARRLFEGRIFVPAHLLVHTTL